MPWDSDFAPPLGQIGAGDFASPLLLSAPAATTVALKDVLNNGVLVDAMVRSKLNLIAGTGTTLTIADNPANDRVDVTITGLTVGGTLASAASITASSNVNLLTGTTQVNTLLGGGTYPIVTLIASGQSSGILVPIGHLAGGGNIKLRDSLGIGIYAGESLTFYWNGVNWIEVARDLRNVLVFQAFTGTSTITNPTYTEASPLDVVSAGAWTFDGFTTIRVEFFCPLLLAGAVNGAQTIVSIWDSTDQGRVAYIQAAATGGGSDASAGIGVLTYVPIAGSRTIKARAWQVTATGYVIAGAGGPGAYGSGYIRVSREI